MVTVIIPVFNKKGTIERCLDSVLSNDYQDKEIIAVDDASNDGTSEILLKYIEKNVLVIKLSNNSGIYYACNNALSKSKGDIIIRTDADTVVPPDWISRFMAHFENPCIIAVGGSTYHCLNTRSIIARSNSILVNMGEVLLKRSAFFGKLPGANRAVRKSLLLKAGEFSGQNDRDLFRKLKRKGKIIFDSKIVVKTDYPSTLKELWQRKFLWGQSETETTKSLFTNRIFFSIFVILLGWGILFIGYPFFVISIIGYMGIFSLACMVSLGDKGKITDLFSAPFVLIFSETAFFFGAVKGFFEKHLFKRAYDFSLSLLGMALSLPLWILIPIAIYIEDGRPIFFSDTRAGKDKKPYRHFKFRSMVKNAEHKVGQVWSKEKDERITKAGRILRATAMDELPQLWNILKGDMSFVGPRPERPFFVERFLKEIPGYEKRFSVRPGLTGIAQVYGKYDTQPEKKLEYDLEYIRKMNILLDLKLIFLSFVITLRGGWAKFEKNQR